MRSPTTPGLTSQWRPLLSTASAGVEGQAYILRRPFLMLVGIALVSKLLPSAAPVVLVLVALHALRGVREAGEACLLLVFLLLGNPHYRPAGIDVLRWAVLGSAFLRLQMDAVLHRRAAMQTSAFAWALSFFVLVEVCLALLTSWLPLLSILKISSFFLGAYTLVTVFWRTPSLTFYWRCWIYTLGAFIVVGSFATFVTGEAYIRTQQGAQGIMTHPQVLGPVTATFVAWFMGELLTGRDRSALSMFLIVGGLLLVFLSGSRTAGLALIVGIALALAVLVLRRERVLDFSAISPISLLLVAVFAVVVMILFAPQLRESVAAFILKDDEVMLASELLQQSRGDLMSRSMSNFSDNPVTGIGFGIPSTLSEYVGRSESFFDIPFSASSEKGFMPTAVLEEIGIIGAILVLGLLLFLVVPIVRFGTFGVMWAFWVCMMTNIGEAVLFSVGGLGYFVWMFMAFCIAQTLVPQEHRTWAPMQPAYRYPPYLRGGYGPAGALDV